MISKTRINVINAKFKVLWFRSVAHCPKFINSFIRVSRCASVVYTDDVPRYHRMCNTYIIIYTLVFVLLYSTHSLHRTIVYIILLRVKVKKDDAGKSCVSNSLGSVIRIPRSLQCVQVSRYTRGIPVISVDFILFCNGRYI